MFRVHCRMNARTPDFAETEVMRKLARFQMEFLEDASGDYDVFLVELLAGSRQVVAEEIISKTASAIQLHKSAQAYAEIEFRAQTSQRQLLELEEIDASHLPSFPIFRNQPWKPALLDMGYNWLLRNEVSKYQQGSLSIEEGTFVISGVGLAADPDANRLRKDGTPIGVSRPKSSKRIVHDWF